MARDRKTLLARLAPMFGPRTENLAVEALGHILSESEAARSALSELLQAGGAEVGKVDVIRTQDAGEDGAQPDLAGLNEEDELRVLIEAKFWAGLTANQPIAYLGRLKSAPQPSALLFVAPAVREDSLWAELLHRLSETESGDAPLSRTVVVADSGAEGCRSVRIDDGPHMMLTSWRILLDRMAAKAAGDYQTEIDIRQLQGLAEQQDRKAFLPLRPEELGPGLPRRVGDFTGLVRDAVHRVSKTEWVDVRGAALVGTAGGFGIWLHFTRAEEEFGALKTWFGVSYGHWARHRDTPLWIWLWDPPTELLHRLEPLRQSKPRELIGNGSKLSIPIWLPVGQERGEVLDAVVARVLEIARMMSPGPCEPTE